MIPWNRHGIDWTAHDEEEKATRRCLFGMVPLSPDEWDRILGWFLGALFTTAGLIWWVAACP